MTDWMNGPGPHVIENGRLAAPTDDRTPEAIAAALDKVPHIFDHAVLCAEAAAALRRLSARCAELEGYIAARTTPRQGVEPQYDQSDADAFYLAQENRQLKAQCAALKWTLLDVRHWITHRHPPGVYEEVVTQIYAALSTPNKEPRR